MSMNRRRMLGTGVTAMAALAIPARGVAQDDGAVGTVAGGGAVETPLGMVDFGLVARADAGGTVSGQFSLTDFTQPGNPVVMRSSQLNRLEAYDESAPNARQIVGWVSAGGEAALFVLRVDDLGGAGSGEDTFSLHVGEAAAPLLDGEEQKACDCATYSYSLEGPVVRGDVMVVTA